MENFMGTEGVSRPRRQAGGYAQAHADRLRLRLLIGVIGSFAVLAVAFLAFHGRGLALVEIELAFLLVLLLLPSAVEPVADRWGRGAAGERKVGAILDDLGPDWHALHDIDLGRGNIDHVLVGPGGAFTVETKSHRGRIRIDKIDESMVRQAYAERKKLERVTGLEVEALLVFSEAWLIGSPPARRRGVVILPSRMLADFIARRRPVFTSAEAAEIAERLRLALEVDAAGTR
jgi:hypothetical protein